MAKEEPGSALSYSLYGLELLKLQLKEEELWLLHYKGEALAMKGNYTRA